LLTGDIKTYKQINDISQFVFVGKNKVNLLEFDTNFKKVMKEYGII
jgi:hypothetical protein